MNNQRAEQVVAPTQGTWQEWLFSEKYPDLVHALGSDTNKLRQAENHYQKVLEFCEKYIAPRVLEIDRQMLEDPAYVPQDILAKACEYQLFSMMFPTLMGGAGTDFILAFITYELIATHCVGIANLLGVNGLAIGCVLASFDPRAINHVATLVCENERQGKAIFLSTCVTEPGAGSDAEDPEEFAQAKLQTTATKTDGGYLLNSNKVFISNGSLASLHVVTAFTNPRHYPEDLVLLLVPADSQGVSCPRNEKKMGQKVCPATEVVFEQVFVPDHMVCRTADNVESFASDILANVLGLTRAGVGAFATGVAENAYRTALSYATKASFLGHPMIEQQWVQMALADMARQAQLSRSNYISALHAVQSVGLLEYIHSGNKLTMPNWIQTNTAAAKLRQQFMNSPMANSAFKWVARQQTLAGRDTATAFGDIAKISCSNLAMSNCQKAISLMGKAGLRHCNGAEKLLRDVKLLQIYEGTNQVNLLDLVKRRVHRQING